MVGFTKNNFSNLQVNELTEGKRDKRSSVVCELCLRNGARELHRPLSNKPTLGPELIRERAEVSRVSMHRVDVDRHGGSLWDVTIEY